MKYSTSKLNLKIMIVDDNPFNIYVLEDLIQVIN